MGEFLLIQMGRKNFQVSNQQNNSLNENQAQQMIDIASANQYTSWVLHTEMESK